jgi:threonine aldolase
MQYQTYCEAIVASAAPVNPRFREYTKKGSRTIAEMFPKPEGIFQNSGTMHNTLTD